jgi:hypothetical protein
MAFTGADLLARAKARTVAQQPQAQAAAEEAATQVANPRTVTSPTSGKTGTTPTTRRGGMLPEDTQPINKPPGTFGDFMAERAGQGGAGRAVQAGTAAVMDRTMAPLGRLTGQLPGEGGVMETVADIGQLGAVGAALPFVAGSAMAQATMEALGLTRDTARNITTVGELVTGAGMVAKSARAAGTARRLKSIEDAALKAKKGPVPGGQTLVEASQSAVAGATTRNVQLELAQEKIKAVVPRLGKGGPGSPPQMFTDKERVGKSLVQSAHREFRARGARLKPEFDRIEQVGARAIGDIATDSTSYEVLEGTAKELDTLDKLGMDTRQAGSALGKLRDAVDPIKPVKNAAGKMELPDPKPVSAKDLVNARKELQSIIKHTRQPGDPDLNPAARQAAKVYRQLTDAWSTALPSQLQREWGEVSTAYRTQYTLPKRVLRTVLSPNTSSSKAFDSIFNLKDPHQLRTLRAVLPNSPGLTAKMRIGAMEKLAEATMDFSSTAKVAPTYVQLRGPLQAMGIFKPDEIAAIDVLFRQPEQLPVIMAKAAELVAEAEQVAAPAGFAGRVISRASKSTFAYLALSRPAQALIAVIAADRLAALKHAVAMPRGASARRAGKMIAQGLNDLSRKMTENRTLTPDETPEDGDDYAPY